MSIQQMRTLSVSHFREGGYNLSLYKPEEYPRLLREWFNGSMTAFPREESFTDMDVYNYLTDEDNADRWAQFKLVYLFTDSRLSAPTKCMVEYGVIGRPIYLEDAEMVREATRKLPGFWHQLLYGRGKLVFAKVCRGDIFAVVPRNTTDSFKFLTMHVHQERFTHWMTMDACSWFVDLVGKDYGGSRK